MKIPRSEHPNPQFEREAWLNLNGEWEFEIDPGMSGLERRFYERDSLSGKIIVPFCPESRLSGIGHTDFKNCVWYRREFEIPAAWQGGRVILHFGAVDHTAHVYVNTKKVATHVGGYASFEVDITGSLRPGKNVLHVCAVDEDRNPQYGHGKQSRKYHSYGCYYTRVTGIWQTVWLEHVPQAYVRGIKMYPDIDNQTLVCEVRLCGQGELILTARYEGREVSSTRVVVGKVPVVRAVLKLDELHLWEVGHGRLYDLEIAFGEDRVRSYFGMRSVALDGYQFLINGKSVFQRLVLDQGYYRDGIYTAPSDEALRRDIELSLAAGFNGARLHQKVFEPRFLYHCDRMGYIVWGEYGNWGMDYSDIAVLPPLMAEWTEIVNRDFNHPSIIGWCPLNETWDYQGRAQDNALLESIYRLTKELDNTRPCIDTSGNYHVVTDIYDLHDYIQDPDLFAGIYGVSSPEEMISAYDKNHHKVTSRRQPYPPGAPVFISEYGGIRWDYDNSGGWGYGEAPKTEEEFIDRYRRLTNVLLDNPFICGFCYTQLYDVEQEVNGLYTYDRIPKFDMGIFKHINSQKARIEE